MFPEAATAIPECVCDRAGGFTLLKTRVGTPDSAGEPSGPKALIGALTKRTQRTPP